MIIITNQQEQLIGTVSLFSIPPNTSCNDIIIHSQTYITLWIEETPPTLVKKALRIIVDGLHDFGPIQTLHSLSVLDVTRTVGSII
jgi:hypothetical protein